MENNTIILLLAGVQSGAANPNCRPSLSELDVQESVLRMARLYYERYPFLIDWANIQGKTALHVAALKGNEEFVRVSLPFL
jgi:ankyrin repeat protein